jgi:hypothetical protein
MTNRTEQFVTLFNQTINQAKDSFAKRLPEAEEALRANLKKVGIVSRTEFEALEARVAKLEKAAKKAAAVATTEAPAASELQ